MFDCGDVFPMCVFVIGNGYGVVLPVSCLIVCICCRIRVIGNGYGVVLPVSCLIVEMCFQCVYLL